MDSCSQIQMVNRIGIEMSEFKLAAIRKIKTKVASMLRERHDMDEETNETYDASQVWSAGCSLFDYMISMSDESFSKIRLHTYYLTSDYYLPYVLGHGVDLIQRKWESYVKELPDNYIVYEPKGGFGFEMPGKGMISSDSVRYQQTISTLYHQGVVSNLESDKKTYVLEIGGGYGGLIHHLSNISKSTTYIIIDLPETLLFSASYISMLNPEKSIYVYDKDDFIETIQGDTSKFDFMFIPNFKLSELQKLKFDLVINLNSLGEMTSLQVQEYIDFVFKTCIGSFYSYNQDHLQQNVELSSLTEVLERQFDLIEIPSKEKSVNTVKTLLNKLKKLVAKVVGNSSPHQYYFYREYLAKPRPKGRT